jgi:outer membrane lipoprotein-sorting protein
VRRSICHPARVRATTTPPAALTLAKSIARPYEGIVRRRNATPGDPKTPHHQIKSRRVRELFKAGFMTRTASIIGALFFTVAGAQADPAPPAVKPAAKPAAAAAPAAKPAAAPKPFVPVEPLVAIQKANAYFNAAATMVGDFVQIGADGKRTEGKIFVQRPGRLRFEYAAPATLEIVADGLSVAVHDRKTATKDIYFISQTPLKFLLKDHVDLANDVKIVDVSSDPSAVTIVVDDKATFGGTSQIKLVFDPAKFTLKQWQVTDPQGYETLISLFNIDLTKKPDPNLFQITQERMLNTNN